MAKMQIVNYFGKYNTLFSEYQIIYDKNVIDMMNLAVFVSNCTEKSLQGVSLSPAWCQRGNGRRHRTPDGQDQNG